MDAVKKIVSIVLNAQMQDAASVADVQTVVDEILTVTKDFAYDSGAASTAEVTFNNLSGVPCLISFPFSS